MQVTDLVADYDFTWEGKMQHVFIDPNQRPYFIWRLHDPERGL